jgi:hypothetical protein
MLMHLVSPPTQEVPTRRLVPLRSVSLLGYDTQIVFRAAAALRKGNDVVNFPIPRIEFLPSLGLPSFDNSLPDLSGDVPRTARNCKKDNRASGKRRENHLSLIPSGSRCKQVGAPSSYASFDQGAQVVPEILSSPANAHREQEQNDSQHNPGKVVSRNEELLWMDCDLSQMWSSSLSIAHAVIGATSCEHVGD